MSTTFEVYPQTSHVPSFKEVLAASQQKLHGFLAGYGIKVQPFIAVQLRTKEPDTVLSLDLDLPATWSHDCYAWFHIPPVRGGTDAYFSNLTPEDYEYWGELLLDNERVGNRREQILSCITQGVFWTFRRSAGQSCLISLTYGIIAASFAELTDGFIYTEDSAWDYERFPATAQEFGSWYFRPEQAISAVNKNWAEHSIAAIMAELTV